MASKTKSKSKSTWFEKDLTARALRRPDAAGRPARAYVHMNETNDPPAAWRAQFTRPQPGAVIRVCDAADGPLIVVSPAVAIDVERDRRLRATSFTRVRDAIGSLVQTLEKLDVTHARVELDLPADLVPAATLGVELALYKYKRVALDQTSKLSLEFTHDGRPLTEPGAGALLGRAVNVARHLVNLPPNELDPVHYANLIKDLFADQPHVKVEIWDETRLEREKCGLHLAVGRGAEAPPRLVRISYAPPKIKGAPVALVGKGITFDSGGLDIKPAAGMRLMKKDMGGSAAVVGAMAWAAASGLKLPIEGYVALAENAISARAFRPGDVYTARNGSTVEIHNTDAEGRLVLADAIDVAVSQNPRPRAIVDLATLTGAIKVALGANLAGLFANDDALGVSLGEAGQAVGDLTWPMPLVQRYRSQSNSAFADCVNAVDGFGGAITAALFLEKFARDVPWAHLDIYSWKDAADGAFTEGGGSGQGVLLLAEWLRRLA